MPAPFVFQDPPTMRDGDLALSLAARQSAAESLWQVPAYIFHMHVGSSDLPIGRVTFRAEDTEWVVRYYGHIGYRVEEPYRGRRYAERSCRLLMPFIRRHRQDLWITCAPDNLASRRTIERLGAEFVETLEVPPEYPLPEGVMRKKCRYRLRV
jgi:tagatose 1,6-diphosphate aldolase